MGRIVTLLLGLAAVFFIFSQLMSFFWGTKSMRRQLKRDLRTLRRQLSEIREALIPFEMDEFKILSYSPVIKKRKRGRTYYQNGFLSTIYQEPVMAFAVKNSQRNGRMVMLVESQKDEFIFECTAKEVRIMHNGTDLGIIDKHDRLIDTKGQEMAKLENADSGQYKKIFLGSREVAHLNDLSPDTAGENDRLFSLFHDFNARDEEEFIALALYKLVVKPRLAHIRA